MGIGPIELMIVGGAILILVVVIVAIVTGARSVDRNRERDGRGGPDG